MRQQCMTIVMLTTVFYQLPYANYAASTEETRKIV